MAALRATTAHTAGQLRSAGAGGPSRPGRRNEEETSGAAARALCSVTRRGRAAVAPPPWRASHQLRSSSWGAGGAGALQSDTAVRHMGAGLRRASPLRPGAARAGIRAVENFDGKFQLQPEAEAALFKLLESPTFRSQVAAQPGVPAIEGGADSVAFTGKVFQPVPWSVNTKHGMLPEFEQYLEDKEKYVIVNVPPNYMMVAKVFSPSRLCAIFEIKRLEGAVGGAGEAAAMQ